MLTCKYRNNNAHKQQTHQSTEAQPLKLFRVHPKEHPRRQKALTDRGLRCREAGAYKKGRCVVASPFFVAPSRIELLSKV